MYGHIITAYIGAINRSNQTQKHSHIKMFTTKSHFKWSNIRAIRVNLLINYLILFILCLVCVIIGSMDFVRMFAYMQHAQYS